MNIVAYKCLSHTMPALHSITLTSHSVCVCIFNSCFRFQHRFVLYIYVYIYLYFNEILGISCFFVLHLPDTQTYILCHRCSHPFRLRTHRASVSLCMWKLVETTCISSSHGLVSSIISKHLTRKSKRKYFEYIP